MKNKYSFPRKPQGNNREYNQWYDEHADDMNFINETEIKRPQEDGWRNNGVKHDIYHLPNEGEDYVEDDYTVRQKFEDRTTFTH